MVSIRGAAVYLPNDRIDVKHIAQPWQANPGDVQSKAVPESSEDAVTMSVDAARTLMQRTDTDPDTIDLVLFSSMTAPYMIKEGGASIAEMLDIDALTLDIRSSGRAGIGSLVAAGTRFNVDTALVVAADVPRGGTGSDIDARSGGGSAAFLLTEDDGVAITDSASTPSDFTAEHQLRDENIGTSDPRLSREVYTDLLRKTVEQLDVSSESYDSFVLHGLPGESGDRGAKALGVDPGAVIGNELLAEAGDLGAALAPAQLVAAIDKAEPGDRILATGFGSGVHAISLEVRADVPVVGALDSMGGTERIEYVEYLRRTGKLTKNT